MKKSRKKLTLTRETLTLLDDAVFGGTGTSLVLTPYISNVIACGTESCPVDPLTGHPCLPIYCAE